MDMSAGMAVMAAVMMVLMLAAMVGLLWAGVRKRLRRRRDG